MPYSLSVGTAKKKRKVSCHKKKASAKKAASTHAAKGKKTSIRKVKSCSKKAAKKSRRRPC